MNPSPPRQVPRRRPHRRRSRAVRQTASDCTPNVSGGDKPAERPRSRRASFVPGHRGARLDAVLGRPDSESHWRGGLAQEVPGANQWVMQAEVAVSNFVSSMDVTAQAAKLMNCVAEGPGYSNASPTLGPIKKSSITSRDQGRPGGRRRHDRRPRSRGEGRLRGHHRVRHQAVTIFLCDTLRRCGLGGLLNQVIGSLKVTEVTPPVSR